MTIREYQYHNGRSIEINDVVKADYCNLFKNRKVSQDILGLINGVSIMYGCVKIARLLFKQGYRCTKRSSSDLITKMLIETSTEADNLNDILENECVLGHTNNVRILNERGILNSAIDIQRAAFYNHFKTFKYMLSVTTSNNILESTVANMSMNGRTLYLKEIFKKYIPDDSRMRFIFSLACTEKDTIEYLLNRFPNINPNYEAYINSNIRAGKIDEAYFLMDRYPYKLESVQFVYYAARHAYHPDAVQYLLDKGFSITIEQLVSIETNSNNMFCYIVDRITLSDREWFNLLIAFSDDIHLTSFSYILNKVVLSSKIYDRVLLEICKNEYLEPIKILVEKGANLLTCNGQCLINALQGHHEGVIYYILDMIGPDIPNKYKILRIAKRKRLDHIFV
jgi:hypothetical protein